MIKGQRYDRDQESKEATDQIKEIDMVKILLEQFGRGEITLETMWAKIDEYIDAQRFRRHIFEPIQLPVLFPTTEKIGN